LQGKEVRKVRGAAAPKEVGGNTVKGMSLLEI